MNQTSKFKVVQSISQNCHRNLAVTLRQDWLNVPVAVEGLQIEVSFRVLNEDFVSVYWCTIEVRLVPLNPHKDVVDEGCGWGRLLRNFSSHDLDRIRELSKAKIIVGSNLEQVSRSSNHIYCLDVLVCNNIIAIPSHEVRVIVKRIFDLPLQIVRVNRRTAGFSAICLNLSPQNLDLRFTCLEATCHRYHLVRLYENLSTYCIWVAIVSPVNQILCPNFRLDSVTLSQIVRCLPQTLNRWITEDNSRVVTRAINMSLKVSITRHDQDLVLLERTEVIRWIAPADPDIYFVLYRSLYNTNLVWASV